MAGGGGGGGYSPLAPPKSATDTVNDNILFKRLIQISYITICGRGPPVVITILYLTLGAHNT